MSQQNPLILIIDDDKRNIFALQLVLRTKGYACLSAPDAKTGIQMLKENPQIGIILMDMMMPDMDGYEAIRVIKHDPALSDIPIVAVTAQAMTGDREKCLRAGADAYVSKPVNMDVMLGLLKKYLKSADGSAIK